MNGFSIRCDDTNLAILDLCDYYERGKMITRINVPVKFRGQGFGRRLLVMALFQSKYHKIDLFLEVGAYGRIGFDMNRDQLIRWYERYGFESYRGIYRRRHDKRLGE